MKRGLYLAVAMVVCLALLPGAACGYFAKQNAYQKSWGWDVASANADAYAAAWNSVMPNEQSQMDVGAKMRAGANAQVLGLTKEVFHIEALAQMCKLSGKERNYLAAQLRLVGKINKSIFNYCADGSSLEETVGSGSKVFFEKSKWVWLGPVPIKLTGIVSGEYAYDVYGFFGRADKVVHLNADPHAWARVMGGIGWDMWGAGARLECHILLLDTGLDGNIHIVGKWDFYNGKAVLYCRPVAAALKIHAWLWSKHWRHTFVSWTCDPWERDLVTFFQ